MAWAKTCQRAPCILTNNEGQLWSDRPINIPRIWVVMNMCSRVIIATSSTKLRIKVISLLPNGAVRQNTLFTPSVLPGRAISVWSHSSHWKKLRISKETCLKSWASLVESSRTMLSKRSMNNFHVKNTKCPSSPREMVTYNQGRASTFLHMAVPQGTSKDYIRGTSLSIKVWIKPPSSWMSRKTLLLPFIKVETWWTQLESSAPDSIHQTTLWSIII